MTNRIWTIGSVTLIIVLLLGGWFLGAQPFVANAASADEERASVEQLNAINQAALGQLAEENKDLATIEAEYKELQKSIPGSTDSAAFIKGLDGLAASSGVQISAITVGSPVAYTVPASAQVAVPDPSSTAAPTPAPSTAPVPVEPVGSVAVTSPLITPDNFVGVEVNIDVKGEYDAVLGFMDGLQKGTRLFLVTGFSSSRNADSSDGMGVSSSIKGMIYVLKQPAAN